MFSVHFLTSCFTDPANRRRDEYVLEKLLAALIAANLAFLAANPRTPPLFKSGVRYIAEPPGHTYETWPDIGFILAKSGTDCKGLVSWRIAELRHSGIDKGSEPILRVFPRECVITEHQPCILYHVQVRRTTGPQKIEDPSAVLGMKVPAWFDPLRAPVGV